MTALSMDAIRQALSLEVGLPEEMLRRLSTAATSSELVYTPRGHASFYRDLLAAEGFLQVRDAAAVRDRLSQHREQMDQVRQERDERAIRALRAGGLEYRVEPNAAASTFAPPLWLNELFATANRPHRILADLIPRFPLPAQPGIASINLPIISTGSSTASQEDAGSIADQDVTDTSGATVVAPFAGNADVALQLLELSPVGAAFDWVIFQDLTESYDANLETALLFGLGSSFRQILGLMNVPGVNAVAYTAGSPTGSGIDPFLGKAAGELGDARDLPPQCWMMRTARWTWFQTSADSGTRPFGLDTRFYLGNDDKTPDPIGGFMGWPVFLNEAIPNNLITTISGSPATASYALGGTQDLVLCLRPTDLVMFESDPQTMIAREPLSASAGVRIQMHGYAGSITGRRPAGISIVGGTGLAVQSGF